MYTMLGTWDWNEAMRWSGLDRDRLGTRFPLELGPRLILSPHLYGSRPPSKRSTRKTGRWDDDYTSTAVPDWLLYVARTDEHIAFLRDEVAPAISPPLYIVDPGGQRYSLGAGEWAPLSGLPAILNAHMADDLFGPDMFDGLSLPWESPRLAPEMESVDPTIAARMERAPIRLWEMLFARGHSYRWELVRGEVPLVAWFPSELGANRALQQCVVDALALEGGSLSESLGWIVAGRFRLRQRATMLEVRARLSAADIRAAFLPAAEIEGDTALPSLVGVLTAGGDNGKTEMMDGYTWSSVLCLPGEPEGLAESLKETIERWCGAPRVDVFPRGVEHPWPEHEDGRWEISFGEKYLTVYTPMLRDEVTPFEVVHPRWQKLARRPPLDVIDERWAVKEGETDREGALEKKLAEHFEDGAEVVWLVRHGEDPRVEVRSRAGVIRVARPGEELDMPGVVRSPVRVEAFFHRDRREDRLLQRLLRTRPD